MYLRILNQGKCIGYDKRGLCNFADGYGLYNIGFIPKKLSMDNITFITHSKFINDFTVIRHKKSYYILHNYDLYKTSKIPLDLYHKLYDFSNPEVLNWYLTYKTTKIELEGLKEPVLRFLTNRITKFCNNIGFKQEEDVDIEWLPIYNRKLFLVGDIISPKANYKPGIVVEVCKDKYKVAYSDEDIGYLNSDMVKGVEITDRYYNRIIRVNKLWKLYEADELPEYGIRHYTNELFYHKKSYHVEGVERFKDVVKEVWINEYLTNLKNIEMSSKEKNKVVANKTLAIGNPIIRNKDRINKPTPPDKRTYICNNLKVGDYVYVQEGKKQKKIIIGAKSVLKNGIVGTDSTEYKILSRVKRNEIAMFITKSGNRKAWKLLTVNSEPIKPSVDTGITKKSKKESTPENPDKLICIKIKSNEREGRNSKTSIYRVKRSRADRIITAFPDNASFASKGEWKAYNKKEVKNKDVIPRRIRRGNPQKNSDPVAKFKDKLLKNTILKWMGKKKFKEELTSRKGAIPQDVIDYYKKKSQEKENKAKAEQSKKDKNISKKLKELKKKAKNWLEYKTNRKKLIDNDTTKNKNIPATNAVKDKPKISKKHTVDGEKKRKDSKNRASISKNKEAKRVRSKPKKAVADQK